MALSYPDILKHENNDLAIADSDFVKGGTRSPVANLTALYALSSKIDGPFAAGQLKERSTRVYVIAESAYYELIDIDNVGNSAGWQVESSGGGLVSSNFVFGETPSGTINGSNAVFTLAHTPISGTITISVNGIIQKSGSGNDYTISGSTITFESGNIPVTLDSIIANYLKA
jgi:hypothetical protein